MPPGERDEPLTTNQKNDAAKKLEELADKFLKDNSTAAYDAWHDELRQVARHGLPDTLDVFKKIEKDGKSANPLDRKILVNNNGDTVHLTIQSSPAARVMGTKQYVGAVVSQESVLTAAKSKKGKVFAGITDQDNRTPIINSESHSRHR